jgi:hypothetical protein
MFFLLIVSLDKNTETCRHFRRFSHSNVIPLRTDVLSPSLIRLFSFSALPPLEMEGRQGKLGRIPMELLIFKG